MAIKRSLFPWESVYRVQPKGEEEEEEEEEECFAHTRVLRGGAKEEEEEEEERRKREEVTHRPAKVAAVQRSVTSPQKFGTC